VHTKSRLVGAAAFQEIKGVLGFAGKGPSDYSDFIISDSEDRVQKSRIIESLLSSCKMAAKGFRYFYLQRIRSNSQTLELLKNGRHYNVTVSNGTVAPTLEMIFADEKLKKKSMKRNERVLKRLGKLTSNTYDRADDILPLLDNLFKQHIQRWSKTNYPSLFLEESNRIFYNRLTEYLDTSGWLRFTTLVLDDHKIANHFGFHYAGSYIWYKPSFDIAYSKFSPGEVLLKHLIKEAISENAKELDFTIGGEKFKYRFASKIREVVNVHVTDSLLRFYAKRTKHCFSRSMKKAYSTIAPTQ
jgi:CelD/BcsL family acetyltransferase involved in cellulose biosynthesis